jgi:hypothetical protein
MTQSANQKRINFKELPARALKLKPSELSSVFGGCAGPGGFCKVDCDCCHYDNAQTRCYIWTGKCQERVIIS